MSVRDRIVDLLRDLPIDLDALSPNDLEDVADDIVELTSAPSPEEPIELVVTVAQAAAAEWFVEWELDGILHKTRAPLGEPVTIPAGAKILGYGPVPLPEINLGHSIRVLPDDLQGG